MTISSDFPLVSNIGPSAPMSCGLTKGKFNCPDGFILKLSADGSQLVFSSLLGGSQSTTGFKVRLNPVTGDVVVLGETNAADFKPAPTTLQTTFAGGTCANSTPCFNGFLIGLNPTTGALRYGTFFGSAATTSITGLAVDATGDMYLSGSATPPLSSSLGAVTHTYAPNGAATSGSNAVAAMAAPGGEYVVDELPDPDPGRSRWVGAGDCG